MGADKPHILHCHSTFSAGGKELRCVQLINAMGRGVRHTIVSGDLQQLGAAERIDRSIEVDIGPDFPALRGKPLPGRLLKLAQAMKPFDLVLTYNWGAMDVAMAHTLFSEALGLPPLIHHEDGFNEDEARKRKKTRNWYRKIALGKAAALVVPSETLEEIALTEWEQPIGRVRRIANGIDVAAYRHDPAPDTLRVVKHEGEKWVGTLAGLRPVKRLPALVRAFADLPEEWQLVILGEGPEKERIRQTAVELEVGHRVHLPGYVADPSRVVGLFDIFALSSGSEQFPISVVEAMAAGRPVAAPAVGDVANMVSADNVPFITAIGDDAALASSLHALAEDEALRVIVGEANRQHAERNYDQAAMIDAYRRLYSRAMGREIE